MQEVTPQAGRDCRENGEAEIRFYNNCRTSQLSVEAEGQSPDGTLLWSK